MNQFKWKDETNANIILCFELFLSLKLGKISDPSFKKNRKKETCTDGLIKSYE